MLSLRKLPALRMSSVLLPCGASNTSFTVRLYLNSKNSVPNEDIITLGARNEKEGETERERDREREREGQRNQRDRETERDNRNVKRTDKYKHGSYLVQPSFGFYRTMKIRAQHEHVRE